MFKTFYITCPETVIKGSLITKEKRHEIFGRVAGGAGSCNPENFQRKMIVKGTGIKCEKTNMRINLRTYELVNIRQPNKNIDGFDYSEDFDGIQSIKNKNIYINLKCVVGHGGSQTRSLREVYWFILGQLNILKKTKNIYFANILDGDQSNLCMSKYNYLLEQPEYIDVSKNIYVGDLKDYFNWFNLIFKEEM